MKWRFTEQTLEAQFRVVSALLIYPGNVVFSKCQYISVSHHLLSTAHTRRILNLEDILDSTRSTIL